MIYVKQDGTLVNLEKAALIFVAKPEDQSQPCEIWCEFPVVFNARIPQEDGTIKEEQQLIRYWLFRGSADECEAELQRIQDGLGNYMQSKKGGDK